MNACHVRLTRLARRAPIAHTLIRLRHGSRGLGKHAHATEGAHAAHGCVEAERMRHSKIERGKDEGDARGKQGYAQLVEQAHPRGEHAAGESQRDSESSCGTDHAQHGQGACRAARADSGNKQPHDEGKQRGAYLAQRTRDLGEAGVSHAQGRHEQQSRQCEKKRQLIERVDGMRFAAKGADEQYGEESQRDDRAQQGAQSAKRYREAERGVEHHHCNEHSVGKGEKRQGVGDAQVGRGACGVQALERDARKRPEHDEAHREAQHERDHLYFKRRDGKYQAKHVAQGIPAYKHASARGSR